ncbi:MAG: diguanylate cyclase [Thermodesulfovibrionales bacterium]
MAGKERILIVRADEARDKDRMIPLQGRLAQEGFEADCAGAGAGSLAPLLSGRYDVLLVEHRPPALDGHHVLQSLKEAGRETPVIVIVPLDAGDVSPFLKEGAFDVVRETPDMSFAGKIPHCVRKALGEIRLRRERKEAEERLARERVISEATLQSVVNGIVFVNTRGIIEKTNRTLDALLGEGVVPVGESICKLPVDHPVRKLFLKPLELGTCWEIRKCSDRECPLYGRRDCLCWVSGVPCSRCSGGEESDRLQSMLRCPVYCMAYEKFYTEPLELVYNGRVLYVYRRNVIGRDGMLIGEILDFIDMTAEKNYQERLRLLAVTDPLTGLHNRRYVLDKLEEEFYESRRYGRTLSLLLIDIDNFKRINDTFGHPVGDEVLMELSAVLESDRRKSDVVGRLGGEEFIVVMPHTALYDAVAMAERLRERISAYPFKALPAALFLTVSIGVASLAEAVRGTGDLLKSADTALYRAKARGKNCVMAQ